MILTKICTSQKPFLFLSKKDNVRELLELNLNPVRHFEEVIVKMDSVGQKTVQKGSFIPKLASQTVFIYGKFQVIPSNILWI